jgi:DNA-binding Lrp family transcriptional regulator
MPNTLESTPHPLITDLDRPSCDRRLLNYVGRHGAVSISHVRATLGLGQTAAYDRVAALIEAGLIERLDTLSGEPSLLRATRSGLRYGGLDVAPAVVSPGSVDHWLRCASVAVGLEALHGAHRILTVRELIVAERHEERPIASAKIGELPNGVPRLHRPDLVVLPEGHPLVRFHGWGSGPKRPTPDGNQVQGARGDDEAFATSAAHHPRSPGRGDPGSNREPGSIAHARTRERGGEATSCGERLLAGAEHMRGDVQEMGVVAIEVELTPKSPRRLREIIRGWRRASWVEEVHYLCEPGQTRRAVERAVEKLHAADRIVIGQVPR